MYMYMYMDMDICICIQHGLFTMTVDGLCTVERREKTATKWNPCVVDQQRR